MRPPLALVTVVLVGSVVFTSCGTSDVPEASPATTTSTTTATTTTSATMATTTTTATAAALPASLCCDGVEIPAGTYRLPNYWTTPLNVDVGEGWRAVFDNTAALMAFVQGQNAVQDPSRWLYLIRAPVELSPQDVIAAMAGMDEVGDVTEPKPVEIAGYSAFQVDAAADEDPDQEDVPALGIEAGAIRFTAFDDTGYFPDGFFVTSATRGSRLRFFALDVGERTMLAVIDAPPDEFAAFADQAAAVLDSMRPPSG